jgi:haloacetate dehalogenase
MFEGFDEKRIQANGVEIFTLVGGAGPPLLLLHGYPQNHFMWHLVAPVLSQHFTLVCPDMRGYGQSEKPQSEPEFANYSKREMARDMVDLMAELGFDKFMVAGHDRGGRCAYRLALDHPNLVQKLVVLDIIPTYEQLERLNAQGAYGGFHWYFMGQEPGFPEKLIGADPAFYLSYLCNKWAAKSDPFAPEAMAEYVRSFSDPETIRATCDEYRNNPRADHANDKADKDAGNKISCPTLVLWGDGGRPHKRQGSLALWQEWAVDVRGCGLPCGHFLAEELPNETATEMIAFLAE